MTDPRPAVQTSDVDGSTSTGNQVAALRRPWGGVAADERPAVTFEAIYREHFAYVWRALLRLGAREADAPDLAHDVFVVVHRKLASFDASRPVKPWLYGIAFRVALDHRRKGSTQRELPDDQHSERVASPTPSPEQALDARQAHDRMLRALTGVDLEQRAVFVLHELEGMSMPEIAAVIDAPLNTLYSRLRLARAAFVRALAQEQGGAPARTTERGAP